MKQNRSWMVFGLLAITTLACGFNVDIPVRSIETGPIETGEIKVDTPSGSDPARVKLEFGAGELEIRPGADEYLIDGTARYNVEELAPQVHIDGNQIRIEQGDFGGGIPDFGDGALENTWDLSLSDHPMHLQIDAGAYRGEYELGGLSLHSLNISDGAADVSLRFSEPNAVEMEEFEYQTGASSVSLENLANAHFERMTFRAGAGDYELDFGGELQRSAHVVIEGGLSNMKIIVPEGVRVELTLEGALVNVSERGTWEGSGDRYWIEGEGPGLTIEVQMGAGSLELETR